MTPAAGGEASGGPGLPEWASAFLPAFRDVLRVVELSSGFTLVPVEVSGPDVARALADWLGAAGHPATVVAPFLEEEWQNVVATLFAIEPHPDGVVLLVGSRDIAPALVTALRLVNQRRDTIARHLACPLLWCGPHEFLDETWQIAPDFWSIRAMTHAVEGALALPTEPTLGACHWVSDSSERLREIWVAARRRRDVQSMQRVALHLATALMNELAYEEAEEILGAALYATDDATPTAARTSLLLLRAQLALLRGALDDARVHYTLATTREPATEGERFLVAGNIVLASDPQTAMEAYEKASEAFARVGDRRNDAIARWSIGNALIALEELELAAIALEDALGIFRELADARNEARALSSLGRVHAALHDMRKANAYFDDALAVTRELGDRHGEATVLRRLARIYVSLGDPEKALEDCGRALAIARSLGDRRGEGKSLTVLGAAHAELGDRARARTLYEEALAIANELSDARMRATLERSLRSVPPPPSLDA